MNEDNERRFENATQARAGRLSKLERLPTCRSDRFTESNREQERELGPLRCDRAHIVGNLVRVRTHVTERDRAHVCFA